MESMTDWAFSWPISICLDCKVSLGALSNLTRERKNRAYVGSSRQHFGGGFVRCYGLCGHS